MAGDDAGAVEVFSSIALRDRAEQGFGGQAAGVRLGRDRDRDGLGAKPRGLARSDEGKALLFQSYALRSDPMETPILIGARRTHPVFPVLQAFVWVDWRESG